MADVVRMLVTLFFLYGSFKNHRQRRSAMAALRSGRATDEQIAGYTGEFNPWVRQQLSGPADANGLHPTRGWETWSRTWFARFTGSPFVYAPSALLLASLPPTAASWRLFWTAFGLGAPFFFAMLPLLFRIVRALPSEELLRLGLSPEEVNARWAFAETPPDKPDALKAELGLGHEAQATFVNGHVATVVYESPPKSDASLNLGAVLAYYADGHTWEHPESEAIHQRSDGEVIVTAEGKTTLIVESGAHHRSRTAPEPAEPALA